MKKKTLLLVGLSFSLIIGIGATIDAIHYFAFFPFGLLFLLPAIIIFAIHIPSLIKTIKSFKNNNTLKFESVGLLGGALFGITFYTIVLIINLSAAIRYQNMDDWFKFIKYLVKYICTILPCLIVSIIAYRCDVKEDMEI